MPAVWNGIYVLALIGIYMILLSAVAQSHLKRNKKKYYKNLVSVSLMRFTAKATMEQIKIADIANGVGKMFQSVECRSSFEIQKHKMQIIRAVLHGERQAPTDEQFRFSRTRGACYHGMRS